MPALQINKSKRTILLSAAIVLGLTTCALLLAWFGNDFTSIGNWLSYGCVLSCGLLLFWGTWRIIVHEHPPAWLISLTFGAIALRLILGCFWMEALPVAGYGSNVEKAGYVMKDAYTRDNGAWKLAKSQKPLWAAFTQDITGDQYGGLMFISAAVYRLSGARYHHPLLIVTLTAFFSSLALLFSWGFAKQAWGRAAASVTAWIVALYPEAVLLGSAQMREPFVVTFAALAFYGLIYYLHESRRSGLAWVFAALIGAALFSPPLAAMLCAALLFLALAVEFSQDSAKTLTRRRGFWIVLAVVILLITAGIWLGWAQIAPPGIGNIFDLVGWWARRAAVYQSYLSHAASGWLQREFNKLPVFLHIPVLVLYGVIRPFLPATLVAYRTPLWYGISIWRSLGWTVMLLSLVYASLRAFLDNKSNGKYLTKAVCVIVWSGILIASVRGGGDDWDNARYRLLFLTLQAGLMGWVWGYGSWRISTGLRRALISSGIFFLWFMPWYIRRYHGMYWDVISIFHTIGLALASVVLFLLWDWARAE